MRDVEQAKARDDHPDGFDQTMTTSSALKFASGLSFDALMDRLNQAGLWQWRGSDSERDGDHLWSIPEQGIKLRIFGTRPHRIVQVRVLPGRALTRADVDRVLTERISPAIGATGIEPTETVS